MAEYVPKPDLEGVNSPANGSMIKDVLILVAGFLVIVFIFYFVFIQVTDWAFTRISPETEMRLLGKLWASQKPENDQPNEFNALVQAVNAETKLPLRVSVICDETPNALALPGGTIYLTRGLFSKLKSENGVAFVLAHEIGHFVHRDHIRGIGRQIVFALGASLFGFTDVTSLKSIDAFIARGFDREQEADADKFALSVVQKVYGHTWGAEEFFSEMSKDETAFSNTLSRFGSTHPLSSARLERIRETQRGTPPKLKIPEDHFESWFAHCSK